MMTDEAFGALFTREGLQALTPRAGSPGVIPTLEVWTCKGVSIFALTTSDFNEGAARHGLLASVGGRCAEEYPGVEAIRFASEAWMRRFTPAEETARRGREVSDYDDKQEVIVVFGQRTGGGVRVAHAPMFRRSKGTVERVGAWLFRDAAAAPLLDAFWQGYQRGKGAQN